MIKSMTGFGSGEFKSSHFKGLVEIKSVNHRYLDIAYFLPTGFVSLEERIRQALQKVLARGRVTVCLKLTQKGPSSVVLNKEVIKAYLKSERSLKKEFALSGDLSLTELIRLPGVVEVQETELNLDKMWPDIQKGFHQALKGLMAMQKREGLSIERDVKKQISGILLEINKITLREKNILKQKKTTDTDEEFESYQKSTDINEELSRLKHHTQEYKRLLKAHTALGKKLDFIGQEMQREANTIGSKLQDQVVSSSVIALKSCIEKLREQAQNIE